jgi:hypothetical protein
MWAGVIPICGTKVVTIVTNMTVVTSVTNEGKCHDLTSPFLRRADWARIKWWNQHACSKSHTGHQRALTTCINRLDH